MFDRIEQSQGREGRGRFPARAPNRAAVHESYAEFSHLILRMGPAGPTGKSKRPGARKRSNTAQLQRNQKRHSVCVCHDIIGPGASRQGGHPHVRARVRTRVCACACACVRVCACVRARVARYITCSRHPCVARCVPLCALPCYAVSCANPMRFRTARCIFAGCRIRTAPGIANDSADLGPMLCGLSDRIVPVCGASI